jgi:hypothetical protein
MKNLVKKEGFNTVVYSKGKVDSINKQIEILRGEKESILSCLK